MWSVIYCCNIPCVLVEFKLQQHSFIHWWELSFLNSSASSLYWRLTGNQKLDALSASKSFKELKSPRSFWSRSNTHNESGFSENVVENVSSSRKVLKEGVVLSAITLEGYYPHNLCGPYAMLCLKKVKSMIFRAVRLCPALRQTWKQFRALGSKKIA